MRVNTLYGTKEVVTERGCQMELRYYLVQEVAPGLVSAADDRVTYGVGIVKREGGQEEREWLPGISHSMEQAEALLRQMMEGLVTPVTAAAVADDWMGRGDRMGQAHGDRNA